MNKKKLMKYCSLLLLFALVISCLIVTTTKIQAASKQGLNKKKVTLTVGKTTTLKVNGLRGKITWSSSHPQIASVTDKGKVTAIKKGTATITAKVKYKASSKDSKYKVKNFTCQVTIINKPNDSTNSNNSKTEESNDMEENNYPADNLAEDTSTKEIRIRLTFTGGEAVAVLYDNPTTQSLLSQLPVSVSFSDFGGAEKICYFPQTLSREGAPNGYDPQIGDVACYGPWGNLAIYYNDSAYASGLIPMGYIESGLDNLAQQSNEFEVTIEKIE